MISDDIMILSIKSCRQNGMIARASFAYLVTIVELFLAKDGILIIFGYDRSKARLVPRHLLTRTQRDSDLILRERDPGIGPLGAVIHDMILLSHR